MRYRLWSHCPSKWWSICRRYNGFRLRIPLCTWMLLWCWWSSPCDQGRRVVWRFWNGHNIGWSHNCLCYGMFRKRLNNIRRHQWNRFVLWKWRCSCSDGWKDSLSRRIRRSFSGRNQTSFWKNWERIYAFRDACERVRTTRIQYSRTQHCSPRVFRLCSWRLPSKKCGIFSGSERADWSIHRRCWAR